MTCSAWSITVRWTPGGIPVLQTGHDADSLRAAGIGLAALLDMLSLSALADASITITFNDLHLDGSGLVLFVDSPTRFLLRVPHVWMIAAPESSPRSYPMLDDALLDLYTDHIRAMPASARYGTVSST